MPPDSIQQIIQQARESWLVGNADEFAALFAAEGEFIAPGNRWVGPDQIHQAAAEYAAAYDVLRIEIHQIIQTGDRAVVEWYWQDREKSTGKETRAEDAIVIHFHSGRIFRWREYIDTVSPSRLE
ncbi:MAG: nuclear transport factor 2 family protein [Leptolyngbyaceae cyanobacterium MO_188.B28]|nr:nuclear transport factor 2 family protein [Leptolyngbyaceae cyanobacterium MO_188.B28]